MVVDIESIWDDFLENQYDPAHWEQLSPPSLRDMNVSKIGAFLGK